MYIKENGKSNIEKLISDLNMDHEVFANILNVSVITLYKWINKETYPSISAITNMAKLLNTNIGYLLNANNVDTPNESYIMNARLSEILKEKAVTRYELSNMTGISYATISKLQKDDYTLNSSTVLRIAEYLNVSIDYLLGLTSKSSQEEDSIEDPFRYIKNGEAADLYFMIDNHLEHINILLSNDGNTVYLPNGYTKKRSDVYFKETKIYPLQRRKLKK